MLGWTGLVLILPPQIELITKNHTGYFQLLTTIMGFMNAII